MAGLSSRIKSFFSSGIFPILLVNFIGVLGYSVVIPILIFIVEDFGGNGFIYGILGAMYPFFQFLGAPLLGQLSDKIGRKKVLIISQVGTFFAWVLFLLAFLLPDTVLWSQESEVTGKYVFTLPLAVVFLARIFDGFTGGNISVANAYMSDVSTDEDRSRNFGRMGASTSLGFVVGPAFAGVLAATAMGEVFPLIIAALISLIAIWVIRNRLKESVPCVVDTGKIGLRNIRKVFQMEVKDCYVDGELQYGAGERETWESILRVPGIPRLFAVYFLTFLGFSFFYASFPVYAGMELEWKVAELGFFYAYFSLVMVFVQGPVLTRMSKKFESQTLVLLGAALLAIGFFVLSTEYTLALYGGATLMAFGNGLMWASFLTILSTMGKPSQQGAIQGYGSSMGSIANMLGLIMGGMLFVNLGTSVFALGSGIFIVIALLFAFRLKRDSRKKGVLPKVPLPDAGSS